MAPSLKRLRHMFKPQKIGHTVKGIPQYIADSLRGLRWMRRVGKTQADRNTITTKDRVPTNTHYDRPLLHGFYDPTGHFKRWQRITNSTWDEVKHLRTKKGNFRINKTDWDLAEMARLGYKVAWIEPKSWVNMDNQSIWDYIASLGHKHGITLRGYTLPGNKRCLPYMNEAGIESHPIGKRK